VRDGKNGQLEKNSGLNKSVLDQTFKSGKAGEVLSGRYWVKENTRKKFPSSPKGGEPLRIADFFCGCGGLTLGALIASKLKGRGLQIALAADAWSDALDVYRKNFRHLLVNSTTADLSAMVSTPGSVTLSVEGGKVAESIGDLDLVIAGPPCQGHSDLNNSSRRDDPRNLLYAIPVAFALRTRAKILVVENVPAVVHATGKVVGSALNSLEENGYSVEEFVADVQDFGLPQTRKRHVLIASRIHSKGELGALLGCITKRRNDVPLWPYIHDLEFELEDGSIITKRSKISPDNQGRIRYLFEEDKYDLPDHLRPPCHSEKTHSYVSMYGRLHSERPAQTITSGFGSMGQGRFVHPTQPRMITAHEAARIQGFPDYFSFSSVKKITALREMIGNAVPPPVGAVLLSLLLPPDTSGPSPR
jgi:DNA (cytosine-5)-methyltransferase 1